MTFPRIPRLAALLLIVPAWLASALSAGEWTPLFNGRDLTGWKPLNGTAPYTVVDGCIVGTTVPDTPNSFLATEKTYGDFIFECEVLQEGGPSNSGVQFRGLTKEDGRVIGYQSEIDPGARAWTAGIYDEARRGWLYPVTLNPRAHTAYLYGRWNQLRIEAIGTSLRTWINGIPVSHVIDDLTPEGFIALQIHGIGKRADEAGRRVYWRNLRIQTTDLRPAPLDGQFIRNLIPNHVSEAERSQGWRLLWDGRTTRGWRAVGGTAFPASGWTSADGQLSVLGTKGGDIVTEEEFSAFELQLEFKLTEAANSGVKYFVAEAGGKATGLEFQLIDDAGNADAKLGAGGDRTVGSLYDLIPRGRMPGGLAVIPRVGEWQHARVVVTPGNQVEHWLNGIKVVDYERGSPLFTALVARSKFAKIPGFGLGAKGPILLQDHGDIVHFRSIKIRPLAAP